MLSGKNEVKIGRVFIKGEKLKKDHHITGLTKGISVKDIFIIGFLTTIKSKLPVFQYFINYWLLINFKESLHKNVKKYILNFVFIVFVVVNINCSNDKDSLPQRNDLVSVTIKEYKTNLPLEGVKISTYFCNKYDFEFGACTDVVRYAACITDIQGICKFGLPENDFHSITIEKSVYWIKFLEEISEEIILQPEAWVDINFITGADYPTASYFFILVIGENGEYMNYIQAVNNSNTTLTLYGNENNKIEWVLYEAYNASSAILNSGNFELTPEKFENLSHTLNY